MSKLEELIQELCPNGVEIKYLWECTIWDKRFNGVDKYKQPKVISRIHVSAEQLKSLKVINGTVKLLATGKFDGYTTRELAKDFINNDEVITIPSGGGANIKYYDGEYVDGGNILAISSDKSKYNLKFIYHYLLNNNDLIESFYRGGSVKHPEMFKIVELKIPMPPIEVQSEIVRMLDNFTLLTAELTAELTARKEQYEYYRDSLLTFDIDIPKVKLSDIATSIYRGSGITREMVTDTGIPCVRYGEIYTKYNLWFDNCVSHTKIENVQSPKYFEYGDILFAITGESIEDIAKSVAYIGNDKCLAGGDIVVLKHNQNPKYLSLVLSTADAVKQKGKGKVKSKVVHSSVPAISEIEIPLPSLEVQEKLVNVLENFESLCNNLGIGLPAEIEARQQQYEFYRTKLLTMLSEGVDLSKQASKQASKIDRGLFVLAQYIFGCVYVELEVICKIKNGRDYKHLNEGKIPVYGSGGIINNVDSFIYNKKSVLIPRKGTLTNIFYVEKPFWNVDTIFYTEINEEFIMPKYLYYYLQSYHLERLNIAGGVPSLTQSVLNKVLIPVPSIIEQQSIVNLLDKFDLYCNDISQGLPAEIELRQQQYEYYRNKLLTFEELK